MTLKSCCVSILRICSWGVYYEKRCSVIWALKPWQIPKGKFILVRLRAAILLSRIVIDIWFVLWLFSRLNNLFFFIVFYTSFVIWLFSSLNNLFFIIVIDFFEEKLAPWHLVKYDSIEWLLTDHFCLMIW